MNKELIQLVRDVALAVLPISLIVCVLQIGLLHMPWDVFGRFALGALLWGAASSCSFWA